MTTRHNDATMRNSVLHAKVYKYTERFWGSAAAEILPEDKKDVVEKAWLTEGVQP
jgi:hypothetical protein